MPFVLLRVAMAVAGVPMLALVVLVTTGSASPPAALWAALAILAAAFGLAWAWAGQMHALAQLLHDSITGAVTGVADQAAHAGLALPAELLGEVALLTQTLGAQTEAVERLRRSEESILERLTDPLIVLGPDRTVRRTNTAARTAFGADIAAVLRNPDLRAAIDRALASNAPQEADVRLPVPVPREVHAMVAAMDPTPGQGAGVLLVLSDRTRERAIERTRADFVANASHELRTPLASLIGFIDTLRGPARDDEAARARFLDIMAEQAARMNRLLDDLLSLSRIELTEHQPPSDLVDLFDAVTRMLAEFEIRMRQRGMTVRLDAGEELPEIVGDSDQLEQVLQNLLDNAVKYGREGGTVTVSLRRATGEKWPARPGLVLSVSDDGAGIPKAQLPRLTERFYRVDSSRSRSIGGTGLGLAIAKHVVNRHRGILLIESEEGQGATFSVWLPT
jgi:two-component system phosphate regulon sensor histidine kinase PhoR